MLEVKKKFTYMRASKDRSRGITGEKSMWDDLFSCFACVISGLQLMYLSWEWMTFRFLFLLGGSGVFRDENKTTNL